MEIKGSRRKFHIMLTVVLSIVISIAMIWRGYEALFVIAGVVLIGTIRIVIYLGTAHSFLFTNERIVVKSFLTAAQDEYPIRSIKQVGVYTAPDTIYFVTINENKYTCQNLSFDDLVTIKQQCEDLKLNVKSNLGIL